MNADYYYIMTILQLLVTLCAHINRAWYTVPISKHMESNNLVGENKSRILKKSSNTIQKDLSSICCLNVGYIVYIYNVID